MPDLSELREDVGVFAAAVAHPLTEVQRRALALEARTTAIIAPRQTGKSRSLAVLSVWWAYRRPRQTVLIVSAGDDAARRLLALVRGVLVHPLLAGAVVDESSGRVTLSNGSTILATPASERAIRGLSVDLLVLDEASMIPDDVAVGAALPTTAARPDARIVMGGTPWAGGLFETTVNAGDSEHQRVFRWSLDDAPWIAPGVIEAARQSMSPARFAAEYLALSGHGGGGLFSRALLDRCTADVELPPWGPGLPCRPVGGMDYGAGHDLSVLGWIARLPVSALNPDVDPERPIYVAATRAWSADTPLSTVAAELVAQPTGWSMLTTETNGLGAGPSQDLARLLPRRDFRLGGGPRAPRTLMYDEDTGKVWPSRDVQAIRHRREIPATKLNALATTQATKALAFERLRWLMDRGQLVLPRDEDLLRELAGVSVTLTAGGGERIEGPPGGHDDRPDALAAAMGVLKARVGGGRVRLRCVVAEHADRTRSEAETPALAEPVVTTGGGLRVYRRPPLQSVGGPGLWVPPGVRHAERPEDPARLARADRFGELLAAMNTHEEGSGDAA